MFKNWTTHVATHPKELPDDINKLSLAGMETVIIRYDPEGQYWVLDV